MATWNGTYTGNVILVGEANTYLEKIVKRYRDEKGVPASKPFILNKIISDYSRLMPNGELGRKMNMLRLHFCFLSFTERDYVRYGVSVRGEFRIQSRDLIREIKEFNKNTSSAVSNIREIPNAIIHDFINIARINGEEFDDFYLNINKTNG